MVVRISFDGWFAEGGLDAWSPIPRFRIEEGEDSLGIVLLLVSKTAEQLLLNSLGLRWKIGEHEEPVVRAMLRFGVQEIERRLQQGILPTEDSHNAHEIAVSTDDLPLLSRLAGEKDCEYQTSEGRDLYCLAAAANDETARWVINGRSAAPTSRPLCRACRLPDTDYLCSNFSHAEVLGSRTMGPGGYTRDVYGGLCQAGRLEIDTAPGDCRPAGNACWERRVSISIVPPVPVTAPLQLPEAVDHLDMAWRLLFGRDVRLLRAGAAADIAALMMACASREEFESRLSNLADLLKRLDVSDECLPEASHGIDKSHSLERLKAALVPRVEGADIDEVEGAIALLQAVNRIRVGQQHSGANPRIAQSFEALNLRYPVDDWGSAWSELRSTVANALLRLAHVVRRLDPDSSEGP